MQSLPAFTKAYCSTCAGERNHVVLHCVSSTWQSDDRLYNTKDHYETLQCAGCDSIKLRNTSTYSWEPERTVTYFPPPLFRQRPKWFYDLDLHVASDESTVPTLLEEIYIGLQNGLVRSPAMAARALLEFIMIEKTGDKGSFSENLAAFSQDGYVSKLQKERLATVLEAGHATIHRAFAPTKDDLVTIVDIVENLIESLYIHDSKVSILKKRVPERNKK